MMGFSEKLMMLRRREGVSQEQLADRLGVSRQSVSKWESGSAMPEIVKLISLSEIFGVSVDYLVKDRLEEPEDSPREKAGDDASGREVRLEQKVDELTRYVKGHVYRYDSKTRIFGLPLVSVRIGFVRGEKLRRENVARGIIAIGNAAVGIVSVGMVGVGAVSVGVVSLGLLALGVGAVGLLAAGITTLGIVSLGVSAIGIYAGGVAAAGREIALGVAAVAGETAVGCDAQASHVLLWGDGLTSVQIEDFLRRHHPDLWRPLLRVLSWLGSNIK